MDNYKSETYISRSENETIEFARRLAEKLKGDEVLLLMGELGAGKTVFAKGIASGLDFADTTQVCSPSYTLVNVYDGRVPVYHIDLYRLTDKEEMLELGWEDFLEEGVVVVEWADKLPFRPDKSILVEIRIGKDNERIIRIKHLS